MAQIYLALIYWSVIKSVQKKLQVSILGWNWKWVKTARYMVATIFSTFSIFFDNDKVYVISYPNLNHMFAGFGWLFWIFVYILAAQISAGQAGPESKKVRQTQQSHDLTADKKWRRL